MLKHISLQISISDAAILNQHAVEFQAAEIWV